MWSAQAVEIQILVLRQKIVHDFAVRPKPRADEPSFGHLHHLLTVGLFKTAGHLPQLHRADVPVLRHGYGQHTRPSKPAPVEGPERRMAFPRPSRSSWEAPGGRRTASHRWPAASSAESPGRPASHPWL